MSVALKSILSCWSRQKFMITVKKKRERESEKTAAPINWLSISTFSDTTEQNVPALCLGSGPAVLFHMFFFFAFSITARKTVNWQCNIIQRSERVSMHGCLSCFSLCDTASGCQTVQLVLKSLSKFAGICCGSGTVLQQIIATYLVQASILYPPKKQKSWDGMRVCDGNIKAEHWTMINDMLTWFIPDVFETLYHRIFCTIEHTASWHTPNRNAHKTRQNSQSVILY